MMKIYEMRRKYTWDAEHEAVELEVKAIKLETTHEQALREMLKEEHQKRLATVAKGVFRSKVRTLRRPVSFKKYSIRVLVLRARKPVLGSTRMPPNNALHLHSGL